MSVWDEADGYVSTVLLPPAAKRVLGQAIEPDWIEEADCASIDPELWFPEKGGTFSRSVREICASCPVRRSCLATALARSEDGIWGGVTVRARSAARTGIAAGAEPLPVLDALLDGADPKSWSRSRAA